jgi:Subtilase family
MSLISPTPYHEANFAQMGVTDLWQKYEDRLDWGKGQCLAILDDGCDLADPAWQVTMPWGSKVVATWNSIDQNEDCHPMPPGYHGTSVGYPSSQNVPGSQGVAYNNFVAHVRCVTIVHLRQDESATMAAGLRWVREHHEELNITAVNLSPLDDEQHQDPVPTSVDAELRALRELNIWVSAPAGNHNYTDGISWPACQPDCFAIGATMPGKHEVHLDRWSNIDLLAAADATSSSNAHCAAGAQVLREAIEQTGYAWQAEGETLPDAMLAIFQKTGIPIHDAETGINFKELNLLAAVNHIFDA